MIQKKHTSYSAYKTWNECPHKHKLMYIDRISSFEGNEYTAFGTAIHKACEEKTLDTNTDEVKVFLDSFLSEVTKLKTVDEDMLDELETQGVKLVGQVYPELEKEFPGFKVFSAEESLYEEINDFLVDNWVFKGYIDLVITTPDGKCHIIDYKSCGWGWDSRKKNNKIVTAQLTLYKNYFAKKYDIDPNDIETYFALLKRTANKNQVEFVRATSGTVRTKNVLESLEVMIKNVERGRHIKNRTACEMKFGSKSYFCPFYRTKHCK